MNDQANKVLGELLQKASDGIDAAVSFIQAQIPDVVHQLLVWNFVQSLACFFVAILSIPLVIYISLKSTKRTPDGVFNSGEGYSWDQGKQKYRATLVWDRKGDIHPGCLIFGGGVMLWAVWFIAILTNLTWLKIWIAPKLYLIEYAASLIK